MLDLQHLRAFLVVAEAGSLTRAGELLHLSQPAVSAQIKSLELDLGVALFRRAPRGVALTDAGEALLKDAKLAVHQADAVERSAARWRGAVMGTLRLGIIDCGYDLKLARLIGGVTEKHPELKVELVAANSGENVHRVLDQRLDLAYVEGEWEDERLSVWRLGYSRVGVIGPRQWKMDLEHAGWPRLSEFPWVFQSTGCSHCRLLEKVCADHQVSLSPKIHSEAYGTVKEIVAEGLALSIADLNDVADLVETGDLFVWPGLAYDMPAQLVGLASRSDEPMLQATVQQALQIHVGGLRKPAVR